MKWSKKAISRILFLVLALSLLTGSIPGLKAASPDLISERGNIPIMPRWQYTAWITGSLKIGTFGLATIEVDVQGQAGVTRIEVDLELEREVSAGNWTKVTGWYGLKANGDYFSCTKSYYVTSGYNYRATLTGRTYVGNSYEPITWHVEKYYQ